MIGALYKCVFLAARSESDQLGRCCCCNALCDFVSQCHLTVRGSAQGSLDDVDPSHSNSTQDMAHHFVPIGPLLSCTSRGQRDGQNLLKP